MSFSEVSFSASNDQSQMGTVRNALQSLHGKVAMLERDRDAHSAAATRARAEHEDFKLHTEAEMNRERMVAAQRERALLEDVAAAEAEINHLKDKLRQAMIDPLPQRGMRTDLDVQFEVQSRAALEQEQSRVRDSDHDIEKLRAEKVVLESANVQLDQHIQQLLRSNEELLQMLRIVPRKAGAGENPATGAAAAAAGGGARSSSALGGPLHQPPLRFQSPHPVLTAASPACARETQSSLAHRRVAPASAGAASARRGHDGMSSARQRLQRSNLRNQSTFERLSRPLRSCSRQRAESPQHGGAGAHSGTSKNTARRFLTQELRAHAAAAIPH